MQDNPEIDAIIEGAVQIAQTWKHEYVLTEHLLLSLIRHDPFRKTLSKYGCDVAMLETELCGYLDSLQSLVKNETDLTPRKTTALHWVLSQARFVRWHDPAHELSRRPVSRRTGPCTSLRIEATASGLTLIA